MERRNTRVLSPPESAPLLTEDEAASIAAAILGVIDQPRRKSDPALKTVLLDFFGTANAGKTTATANLDRFFRRSKYNVFCPPETAEIEEIRNRSTDNPTVFQARHLTGVSDYVVNLANDRNFHMAILSRGLIDMLYWYRMGLLGGKYSEEHAASVRQWVFSQLRMDLVDAFFVFTCDPQIAMEREYANSPTKKQGSNMNLPKLTEAHQLYREVLADVEANVPGLPIFSIDTTNLDEKATSEEVLRQLLPHLEQRLEVSDGYLSKSPSLLRKRAGRCTTFEEQLKLRGQRATADQLLALGWEQMDDWAIEDTYLNTGSPDLDHDGVFEEVSRVRRTGDDSFQFMFKSKAEDRILSHRRPFMVDVTAADAKEILRTYPTLTVMRKSRQRFRLNTDSPDGHFFSLHLDTVDGLGQFTEIRALGSDKCTHTPALLEIAASLGFTLSDIVEGSYLGLALSK